MVSKNFAVVVVNIVVVDYFCATLNGRRLAASKSETAGNSSVVAAEEELSECARPS